jgi:hypothetical protein
VEGLGRLFDIGTGWAPVDLNTADGATGLRIAMSGADGITFVVTTGVAASGTDDLTLNVRQHTAYTSGTSADMDAAGVTGSTGVDHFYIKAETALDNDEPWVKITQTAASQCVVTGTTYAAFQKLIVIEVSASQMAEGYSHLSLDATAGNVGQLSSCQYYLHELRYQRKPTGLRNLLRPSAANA